MKKKITHVSKKGFNQSSKIIAYKLGINASIILSNLIYKHNYWYDENKLKNIDGEYYFYITYINLQAETTLNQSAIKKAIKALKNADLINVKRKGVPATNHYCLNQKAIDNFESKYEFEYLSWIETINNSAKKDRNRFTYQSKIKRSSQTLASSLKNVTEDSEMAMISQIRNAMGQETHFSGLN
ncbi:hypothetical protein QWY87_00495 [Lutimonas halocynthiae]|uniref:hypothetical protein n=1 Tax=Lutimonas halocynthiae TaxID=1446477 RepID=UPI0025B2E3BA|nr:hypothetical protein [Lutimonas halocynthiae]MDN3641160.1 hypothetical protein [Lutimonas halocynthiae]